ncbi:YcxB family protein [Streptomyces sp. NPDC056144]|uniref:YcxB family protein n=1 Tax=unclassified Streptomyces TaxID=2593676 RepID=UPI0035E1CADE
MGETVGETVRLGYSAEFADVHEAVRVRLRATRWWPAMRWTTRIVGGFAVLVAGLALWIGDAGAAVTLVLLGAVAVGAAELIPWGTAWSLFRLIGSQGDATAVVDEDGGRWTSRDTDTTIRWALLPRYVETPRLFVLLTAQRSGTGFAYLPKRGLADPADVDRLRAVLDRYTARA